MRIDDVRSRLVAAYDRGRLVPFLGAGMSYPSCPLWPAFIDKLEKKAAITPRPNQAATTRADHAVRKLLRAGTGHYEQALRECLSTKRGTPPASTTRLASGYWPLVATTNYDDWFLGAARLEGHSYSVVGRAFSDCCRVLGALREPSEPLLWTLHGFLGGQDPTLGSSRPPSTPDELLVGHAEYRTVTHREPHFRRAFAEVFRSCSFLFLGCSLTDTHLLGLFEEVLEFTGPNPQPHYAVVKKGTLDTNFLSSRFNILSIEVDEYGDVEGLLASLTHEISSTRCRPTRWAYSLSCPSWLQKPEYAADLNVVRGTLGMPNRGECIAISAGRTRDGAVLLGPAMTELVEQAKRAGIVPPPRPRFPSDAYVVRHGVSPIYFVAARSKRQDDERDVRVIGRATTETLERAFADGFEHVRFQILASGSAKIFPARFSVAEMLRAYANWRRRRAKSQLRMTIHVVDPEVLFNLLAGRLDVAELLSCADLRFWVEVAGIARPPERQMLFRPATARILDIAADLDVAGDHWVVEVLPHPTVEAQYPRVSELSADLTVESIGVVAGSTLRFVQTRVPTLP